MFNLFIGMFNIVAAVFLSLSTQNNTTMHLLIAINYALAAGNLAMFIK